MEIALAVGVTAFVACAISTAHDAGRNRVQRKIDKNLIMRCNRSIEKAQMQGYNTTHCILRSKEYYENKKYTVEKDDGIIHYRDEPEIQNYKVSWNKTSN